MIQSQVYFSRLAERRELWDELFACLPLAKAYWGEDADQALASIWEQRGKIHTAAVMLAGDDLDGDFRDKLEGNIWEGYNKAKGTDDAISSEMGTAIRTLESYMLPVLRNHSR